VIIVDTSAWVELLRKTGSPVAETVKYVLETDDVVVTEVVVMEVLAGARSDRHYRELRDGLLAFPMLRLNGLADYEQAASIYRTCRANGETIRAMTNCLIAVPAIREGASILHSDSDFDAIARHTELRLHHAEE
jgi:predicted nucleic acid-binding protein